MQRRDVLKAFVGGVATVGVLGLSNAKLRAASADEAANVNNSNESKERAMKYDNDYFYKNGVFQQDKALCGRVPCRGFAVLRQGNLGLAGF